MNRGFFTIGLLFLALLPGFARAQGRLEIVENQGQWHRQVTHRAKFLTGHLYFHRNGWTFQHYNRDAVRAAAGHWHPHDHSHSAIGPKAPAEKPEFADKPLFHQVRMRFLGADTAALQQKLSQPQGRVRYNYLQGKNPEHWAHNLRPMGQLRYRNLYPGVDARLYARNGRLKYDLELEPGADPNQIWMQYRGQTSLELRGHSLHLTTALGSITELEPRAFSIGDSGQKQAVACQFRLEGNRVGFHFPNGYDSTRPLLIDPELIFSTLSGSGSDNWGNTATFDQERHGYSGGIVFGPDFIDTVGSFDTTYNQGFFDAALIKYDSSGQNRLFATFLGGSGEEVPHSLVVNSQNELLVYGTTSSPDFPTSTGAFQENFGGGPNYYAFLSDFGNPNVFASQHYANGVDIFITRLSEDGSQLLGSTYVGGSDWDGVIDQRDPLVRNYGDQFRGEIQVDAQDNVYIASGTYSTDFPTANAFQPNHASTFNGSTNFPPDQNTQGWEIFPITMNGDNGAVDAVVFKLNPQLSQLAWSNFLGGSESDFAFGLDIDEQGNVYAAGGTRSADFPVVNQNPGHSFFGEQDGFLTQIRSDGQAMLASRFTGTARYDQNYFVQRGPAGEIYVYGQTRGNIPLVGSNPFRNPNAGQYIQQYSPDLRNLVLSTTFGTAAPTPNQVRPDISPTAFLVDTCGRIYISGWGGVNNDTTFANHYSGLNPVANPSEILGNTRMMTLSNNTFQNTTDGSDFYLAMFQPAMNDLIFATYFGGNTGNSASGTEHVDGGTSRFDPRGVVYQSVCADCGGNQNFPTTPNAWSRTNQSSNCNNALAKFDMEVLRADFEAQFDTAGSASTCAPMTVDFENQSFQSRGFIWDFGDGDTSHQEEPTHTYAQPGTYVVELQAENPDACPQIDFALDTVIVDPNQPYADTFINRCQGTRFSAGIDSLPGYSYDWSPGIGLSDSTIANPTIEAPGVQLYTVQVQSSGNCFSSFQYGVTSAPIKEPRQQIGYACAGASFTIGPAPKPGYTYEWSSAEKLSDSTVAQPTVTPGGDTLRYTLTFREPSGCIHTQNYRIRFEPDTLADTTFFFNCPGQQLSLALNTDPAASYHWSPSDFLSSDTLRQPVATSTTSITYQVEIRDTNGCLTWKEVHLRAEEDQFPDTSFAYQCLNQPAEMVLEENSAFSYRWSPALFLDTTEGRRVSATVDRDTSVTYTVSVRDSTGFCLGAKTVRLSPQLNRFADTSVAFHCPGRPLKVDFSEPQATNYRWSPDSAISDPTAPDPTFFPGQDTLTYTLRLSHQGQCLNERSVRITPQLQSEPDTTVAFSCIGEPFRLETPEDPGFQFRWAPTALVEDSTAVQPLVTPQDSLDTLYLRKQDSQGNCQQTRRVLLQQTPQQALDTTLSFACLGAPVTLHHGFPARYDYQWQDPKAQNLSDPQADFPTWQATSSSATFSAEVFENGSCLGTLTVNLQHAPASLGDTTLHYCAGGSLRLAPFLGNNLNYRWSPAGLVSDPTNPRAVVANAQDTTLQARVLQGDSCLGSYQVQLEEGNSLQIADTFTVAYCSGKPVEVAAPTDSNAAYHWSSPKGASIANPNAATTQVLLSEDQNLTLTRTDRFSGCQQQFTYQAFEAEVEAAFEYRLTYNSCQSLPSIELENRSKQAESYQWFFGDTTGRPDTTANPHHRFSDTGQKVIYLLAHRGPCQAIATDTVDIQRLQIPNVLTLNGDNKNETWQIGPEPFGADVQVHNRWGEEVYSAVDYQNNWRPSQSAGVYYYLVRMPSGNSCKGWLQIMR